MLNKTHFLFWAIQVLAYLNIPANTVPIDSTWVTLITKPMHELFSIRTIYPSLCAACSSTQKECPITWKQVQKASILWGEKRKFYPQRFRQSSNRTRWSALMRHQRKCQWSTSVTGYQRRQYKIIFRYEAREKITDTIEKTEKGTSHKNASQFLQIPKTRYS